MCGIIGYTGSNLDAVKRAHALQGHRGPDGFGFYSDDLISLGHNRLAIIDLDDRSAQPMWDATRRYCVIFNGEIYNYKQIKLVLEKEYVFKTESDTEVLLALYIKYGEKMCTHLHGMYAFAIYDSLEHIVFVSRDHFGIKPLYYAYIGEQFYFTSELKSMVSLLGSNNIPLEIDTDSVMVYLTLGYTISPRTIYKNLWMLEPGTSLYYKIGEKVAPIKKLVPLPKENIFTEEEFEDFICKKILSNLVSDVPVGVFFSGGTDSSLIAAILHAHGQNLETFSVRIDGRDADTYYFENISKKLKLKNNIYTFDTKAFDNIYQEVLSKLDNPSGTDSIFQTYFIAKKAKEKVKVVLLGDGGDELFYGYPRSFPLARMNNISLNRGTWFEKLYFILPKFYAKNYIFLRLFEWFGSPISYYLNAMSQLRDDSNPFAWETCRKQIIEKSISPINFDLNLYLQEGLLLKNDAATSYCSLEGRVPFLDQDILISSPRFARKSIRHNIPKYTLKTLLTKHLPRKLVFRKKSGFGINYRKILKESNYLHHDFITAQNYLGKLGIDIKEDFNFYMKKHPSFPLVVVTLMYSIKNNKQIYESENRY